MPKISILILLLEIYTQCYGVELGLITTEYINEINFINNITANSLISSSDINSINILNKEISNNFTELKYLLLISSLLSLILGTIVGLAQSRIKRLLAYSTISHIGFILLALAISTEQSIESFIFYIIQYSITNLNTFLILIALSYLVYNSVLERRFIQIIKNNYYFSLMSVLLQTIKSNTKLSSFMILDNLFNLLPEFKLNSKNSIIKNLNKEIRKGLIETDIKYITELKGQFIFNPLIILSLSICLFSMAGIIEVCLL